jgi:nucleoside-diphosphate-sugar epimerase
MSTSTSTPLTILVTGASGYIASWITKYLLEAGHTVHATVRDLAKSASVSHLQATAAQAPGELKLFKADLLTPGSFNEAMQGCSVVIHTASPFILEGYTDAHTALVKPAVEGTRNVLNTVNQCDSVKRVVLTSSVSAMYGDNIEIQNKSTGKFDEADWNTTSSISHNPYQFSKAEAERLAWEMKKKQKRWDLVVINPAMVMGPALSTGSQSGSIDTLMQLGDGRLKSGVPNLYIGVVDVRDVAQAHMAAALSPKAQGRYVVCADTLNMMGIAAPLKSKWGKQFPFPAMTVPKFMTWLVGPLMGPVTRKFVSLNVGYRIGFNNNKSRKDLGLSYRPVPNTLQEHFQQLIEDGLLKPKKSE